MLVGIVGPAQCGKDTLCKAMGWQRAAFADQLKSDITEIVAPFAHMSKEDIRPLMVEYGRLARKSDPDYWVKKIVIPDGDVCITDVRYLNEVEFIESRGGVVVRVVRSGYEAVNDEERESLWRIKIERPTMPLIVNSATPENMADQLREVLDVVEESNRTRQRTPQAASQV